MKIFFKFPYRQSGTIISVPAKFGAISIGLWKNPLEYEPISDTAIVRMTTAIVALHPASESATRLTAGSRCAMDRREFGYLLATNGYLKFHHNGQFRLWYYLIYIIFSELHLLRFSRYWPSVYKQMVPFKRIGTIYILHAHLLMLTLCLYG
jgi:hypothetical protein